MRIKIIIRELPLATLKLIKESLIKIRNWNLFLYIYNILEVLLYFNINSNLEVFNYYLINNSIVILSNWIIVKINYLNKWFLLY